MCATGRKRALALALVLALSGPACRWFRRAPKTAPAPSPGPVVTKPVPPPERKAPPEPEMPEPPQLPAGQPAIAPPPVAVPKPPAPRIPRKARPARKTATAPASAPDAGPESPKPAAPLPQLQQILTPDEERQAVQAFERAEARVEKILALFRQRRLTAEQQTSITRIRAFIEQARQARAADLLTAKALAERAAVLAEDLLKTLR